MLGKPAMIFAKPRVSVSQRVNAPGLDLQEEELARFVEALKKDDYLHSKLFIERLEKIQKLR
jgi:hypothetical protein